MIPSEGPSDTQVYNALPIKKVLCADPARPGQFMLHFETIFRRICRIVGWQRGHRNFYTGCRSCSCSVSRPRPQHSGWHNALCIHELLQRWKENGKHSADLSRCCCGIWGCLYALAVWDGSNNLNQDHSDFDPVRTIEGRTKGLDPQALARWDT